MKTYVEVQGRINERRIEEMNEQIKAQEEAAAVQQSQETIPNTELIQNDEKTT
jgi:hypothetical protein